MGKTNEIPVAVTIDTDYLAARLKMKLVGYEVTTGLGDEPRMNDYVQGFVREFLNRQHAQICGNGKS